MSVRVKLRSAGLLLVIALGACEDDATAPEFLEPTRIEVDQIFHRLESLSDTIRLRARVLDQFGQEMPGVQVVWRTEGDPALEPVDGGGEAFRSVANGRVNLIGEVESASAAINATDGYFDASPKITVSVEVDQVPVALRVVQPSAMLWSRGRRRLLEAELVDARGFAIESLADQVVWASADPAIATITPVGEVTAITDGETQLTASTLAFRDQMLVAVSATIGYRACLTWAEAEDSTCSALPFVVTEKLK